MHKNHYMMPFILFDYPCCTKQEISTTYSLTFWLKEISRDGYYTKHCRRVIANIWAIVSNETNNKNQWTVGNCLLQHDVRLLQCDNSIESIDKDLESPIDW